MVAATIVMNASGGSSKRCGLVKMSSCEEADLCIQKVNKMTLNSRVITVERVSFTKSHHILFPCLKQEALSDALHYNLSSVIMQLGHMDCSLLVWL